MATKNQVLSISIRLIGFMLISLLLSLTGCSLLPDPVRKPEQATFDIPVKWTTVQFEERESESKFYASLNDLIYHPQLAEFIDEAFISNPDLNQLALEVKTSGILLKQVNANRLPSADFAIDANRSKRFNLNTKFYEFGFNVAWEIDLWGKMADLKIAATADYLAQKQEYTLVRNAITIAIIRTWIEAWALHKIHEIEQEYLEDLSSLESILLENYRNGTAQPEDISSLRVQQESVHAEMISTEEQMSRNRRCMELLLGRVPSREAFVDVQALPKIIVPPSVIPAIVLARRPDIQAAFLRLQAFDAQTQASYKALLPSINLSGSRGRTAESSVLSKLFDGDIVWSLVGGLTQPLFHGEGLYAQAQASAATAEASWWAYRKSVLTALQEVENALMMEKTLSMQTDRLMAAKKEALNVQRIYEEKFRSGLVDVLDLIESRLQVLEINAYLIQARAARLDNRFLLAQAMGYGGENINDNH